MMANSGQRCGDISTHALADELCALAQLGHHDARALCAGYRDDPDLFLRGEAARATGVIAEP